MHANTTGASNTAVGSGALFSNTTASNNVAVGLNSLVLNTTGTQNVAVGRSSLDANTTGDNNVGIGYASLTSNTTGASNVAVGTSSLQLCTTGSNNVGLGQDSLPACTTGTGNTACGTQSGLSVTTGSENTLLGTQAASTLTTGDNNLALGNDALRIGSPGGNQTTGSNKIGLGDENITSCHVQVDWTIASDKRDKTDVEPVKAGLDFITKLEPVTYRWDKRSKYVNKGQRFDDIVPNGTHKEEWLDVGFLAQDVEKLESEYGYNISDKTNLTTHVTEDGQQYGLTYNKFVPMLVNAVKELSTTVDELKAEITTLKGE